MTKSYTAILSVHGIGRHPRHSNAGKLLSALEAVSGSNDDWYLDTLIEVQPGIEPPRDPDLGDDVPMLGLTRARRVDGRLRTGANYRVYEVNWSPDTRSRVPIGSMLSWTFKLIRSTFRQDPASWLRWPRLRLARARLAASDPDMPSAERHALVVLASSYRKFRGSLGSRFRQMQNAGSQFHDFLKFAESNGGEATKPDLLNAAAHRWQGATLPCETSTGAAGRVVVISLLFLALFVAASVASFRAALDFTPFWTVALQVFFVTMGVGTAVLVHRFLTTIFSDVRYWSAMSENDQLHDGRKAMINRTTAMLRHLVADPACVRVVIVSHSLGTAIAYDALRAIGAHNQARTQDTSAWVAIRKVECLITMGSPIDKLALLFETTGSQTFREALMQEHARSDMSAMPFWVGDRQRIKWLNFWDAADPVSDPLHIPLGAKSLGADFECTDIENIEVANTRFHDPAGSHTTYLSNPAVAARIYNEIFRPRDPASGAHPEWAPSRQSSKRLIALMLVGLFAMVVPFAAALLWDWSGAHQVVLMLGSSALALGAGSCFVQWIRGRLKKV